MGAPALRGGCRGAGPLRTSPDRHRGDSSRDLHAGAGGVRARPGQTDLLRSTRHLLDAGGAAVDRTDPSTTLFLRFDEDGWFSADSPCGDRYGRYELDGPDRTGSPTSTSTGTGCDIPIDTAIAAVLDVGDDRRVQSTDDGDLIFTAPDGAALTYSYR